MLTGGKTVKSALVAALVTGQLMFGVPLQAQSTDQTECEFDPETPTVLSARASFVAGDFVCAEQELTALLATKGLRSATEADAHMLLAAVYFRTTGDATVRRQKVKQQFVLALRADPGWNGRLQVTTSEFLTILNDAREFVAYLNGTQADTVARGPDTARPAEIPLVAAKSKPWYLKWWALGSGVGVVVLGAVLLLGGGGSGDADTLAPHADTLPGFPPPP